MSIDYFELAETYSTPFWTYDANVIRHKINSLKSFDVIRFAQKACSNTHILRLMHQHGVSVDAVSLGEIERAMQAGFTPCMDHAHSDLVFTADLLDRPTLAAVSQLKVPVNAGSIDMLAQLGQHSPGHAVWLRINPGFGHGHSNKTNTGGEHSKHGIWHADLPEALRIIKETGLRLIGLHMHIGSGVDYDHLQAVCGAMIKHVTLAHELGHDMLAISAGGGLSIPYKKGQPEIDTEHYFSLWDAARKKIEHILGHAVSLEIEPGRYLVAESGQLISEVRSTKHMGKNHFVLVDAGFSDLMRPSMYGSYHEISVLPKDGVQKPICPSVVAGPLCESGDVFTQEEGGVVVTRDIPGTQVGDLVVFHDTGAYGASMSSNYNTRPLIPELLIDAGQCRLIRRRQTVQELIQLENV